MNAKNAPPTSLAVTPWKVIEKALSVDPQKASVIVIVLAIFAAIAIIGTWFASSFDTGLALRVLGIGAVAYVGLAILANLPGLLVRVLSWFITLIFMLLTTVAVTKIVFNIPSHLSIWCLFHWFDQGCFFAEKRPEVTTPSKPSQIDGASIPGPISEDVWVSINRFDPWTKEQAQRLGNQLESVGWDVRTQDYRAVTAAEGFLEVRFSDPKYHEDAVRLSQALKQIMKSDTSSAVHVIDLSRTKWKDKEFPKHIEVWIGDR